MARIVLATWNGGGNLLPALGIARELDRRGHSVAFLGQETQRRTVEEQHLAFTAYAPGPQRNGPPATAAERQRLLMRDIWLNTSLADDLAALLAREPTDGVVVDCMLAGVLARSGEFGVPVAVLVHGLYQSILPIRDAMLAAGNQLRAGAGLPSLDDAAAKWENKDLVLVTTLRELDGAAADPAPNVRYVGPVSPCPQPPHDWPLPWADGDPRPLVLASLSTMPGQTSPATLQRVLDEAKSLPVRVLVTTGVPPSTLTPPGNAAVLAFVPHQVILPHASLMINHAGHGSVTAALTHGVPLVCMPGVGADQPVIAARVEALGAGKTVSREAPAGELRDAIAHVIATAAYAQAARRLARLIGQQDGATNGASALEEWVTPAAGGASAPL